MLGQSGLSALVLVFVDCNQRRLDVGLDVLRALLGMLLCACLVNDFYWPDLRETLRKIESGNCLVETATFVRWIPRSLGIWNLNLFAQCAVLVVGAWRRLVLSRERWLVQRAGSLHRV